MSQLWKLMMVKQLSNAHVKSLISLKLLDINKPPLWPQGEELIPDSSLTCLHCHFYRDPSPRNVWKNSRHQIQTWILLSQVWKHHLNLWRMKSFFGNVLPQATTKFSVKGKQGYSVLNMSFLPITVMSSVQMVCVPQTWRTRRKSQSSYLFNMFLTCVNIWIHSQNILNMWSNFSQSFKQSRKFYSWWKWN